MRASRPIGGLNGIHTSPVRGGLFALEEEIMDKDRIAGSAKQNRGTIKEMAGKAIGDAKLEADGKAEKIEGKAQHAAGRLKDTLRGK